MRFIRGVGYLFLVRLCTLGQSDGGVQWLQTQQETGYVMLVTNKRESD